MSIKEFEAMQRRMLTEGFRRYINPLDAEVVSDHGCVYCEGGNVYATGLIRGKTYYAYAVCRDCDIVEEF